MKDREKNQGIEMMSEKQFRKLSGVHGTHCISIYIPTQRAGEEVDSGQGQLRLKNQLKKLRGILQGLGLMRMHPLSWHALTIIIRFTGE